MPETLEELARAWRERAEVGAARRRELELAARADAESIARFLVAEFGARRVFLFGSLTVPGTFRETSDIDLAAEDIPADLFIRASAEAARLTAFPLDLVPLEDCRPALRHVILGEGVLLAARQEPAPTTDPSETGTPPPPLPRTGGA